MHPETEWKQGETLIVLHCKSGNAHAHEFPQFLFIMFLHSINFAKSSTCTTFTSKATHPVLEILHPWMFTISFTSNLNLNRL